MVGAIETHTRCEQGGSLGVKSRREVGWGRKGRKGKEKDGKGRKGKERDGKGREGKGSCADGS